MSDWCSEHPWMTLFIILALINGLVASIKYICRTVASFWLDDLDLLERPDDDDE